MSRVGERHKHKKHGKIRKVLRTAGNTTYWAYDLVNYVVMWSLDSGQMGSNQLKDRLERNLGEAPRLCNNRGPKVPLPVFWLGRSKSILHENFKARQLNCR
jgi:hypothetical protein